MSKAIQLFETIRIEDGIAHHLKYHNIRLNSSRKKLFGTQDTIDLADYLMDIPTSGLYRAKVIYGNDILNTTYYPYKAKEIGGISLKESAINYAHKYTDRDDIDALLDSASGYDEIIMVRDGLLTDTTIANIALRQDGIWYTPAKPLLHGTTRARLIDEGHIKPRDITYCNIDSYDALALMNAMIGFKTLNLQLQKIQV